uniref:Plastocyanin-like domain-containing protein n=1 Tax=Caenorhabditis tropicalis TaxID=1561998 RepID=A0A1I7T3U5_9PELO
MPNFRLEPNERTIFLDPMFYSLHIHGQHYLCYSGDVKTITQTTTEDYIALKNSDKEQPLCVTGVYDMPMVHASLFGNNNYVYNYGMNHSTQ